MSRLIVLSNRVKMPDGNPMAGGLAVALHDVLVGNSVIWMGWNGEVVEADDNCDNNEFSINKQATLAYMHETNAEVTYMTTGLTSKQYQHFYCGFANNVLWLLLHEQPDLMSQTAENYAGYQEVNSLFARQLKKIIQPDDVIWVHDYHFLSVAYYCKQMGMTNRIGFFLHIPFAPLAFWQQLEKSSELIRYLAHYDVLGTQTEQDKTNCIDVFQHYLKDEFLEKSLLKGMYVKDSYSRDSYLKDRYLQEIFSKSSLPSTLHAEQSFSKTTNSAGVQLMLNIDLSIPHRLTINAYPIGVNVDKIQQQVSHLSSPFSSQFAKHTHKDSATKPAAQQIIAVDRIDYSKGLLERFSAYGSFLQQNPAYQNQLKLLQIACPSRLDLPVYQLLYKSVKQAVNDINQQFLPNEYQADTFEIDFFDADALIDDLTDDLTNNWQAITYSEKVLNHETLMRAFWHSDIGWVNSLKDGMNLVAKEYIAAQNPDNPGVLLLSGYAGAAEQMQAAVIVDPHQPKSIMQGLKTALTMPLAQRKSRYQTLLQGLQQDDLHAWQQNFLDDLYGGNRPQTNNPHSATVHAFDLQE